MATLNLGKVTFTYDDFTPEQLALLKGEKGDKGDKGDVGNAGLRGSRWNTGTAITGTSTVETVYATGIDDSLANDYYFNSSTGCVYVCTLGGDANTARWKFVSNIGSTSFEVELGRIWKEYNTGLTNVLSIAGNGTDQLVAVSGSSTDGKIAFSFNGGVSWEIAQNVPTTNAIKSVVYSPVESYYIAVGEYGTILKSYNGDIWELVRDGAIPDKPVEFNVYSDVLNCVIWNDVAHSFVIAGGEGRSLNNYEPVILTSSDGYNWERHVFNGNGGIGTGALVSVACESGTDTIVAGFSQYLVTGNISQKNWTGVRFFNIDTVKSVITSIKFDNDNNKFLFTTMDGLVYSNNSLDPSIASNWNTISNPTPTQDNIRILDIERILDLDMYIAAGGGITIKNIIYFPDTNVNWADGWSELSKNDKSSESTKNIRCVKYIENMSTFLGREDGKVLKLDKDTLNVNVTDAVKEMYEKLILQK